LNWGGGSRTIVTRMNVKSKRIATLEIAILQLWTAKIVRWAETTFGQKCQLND
jgi:hypothetical protein